MGERARRGVRPARRRRRERRSGAPPAREGGDGGDEGTEAGNTCRQPVRRGGRAAARARARGGEGGAGRAAGARSLSPTTPHAHTRARARSARPGHRGLRRVRPSRAFPSHLRGPSSTRQPLPKESSHRQPRDTAASRGPAPERAPPGCGRRRRGSGDGRAGDAGSEPRRSPPSRGAAAARARPDLAGACGAKTLPDGASGGTRRGEERHRGQARRRPARAPGPKRRPVRADVRVLSRTTTRSHPETGATRPPLRATPARTSSLSGPTRTGRRRRRRRRRPRARRPRRPRGPLATETRPQTHNGSPFPSRIPADRPAGGTTQTGRVPPPNPRRPDLTESSPPGTPRGTEEARGRGGGSADEGGPRAGTEERG